MIMLAFILISPLEGVTSPDFDARIRGLAIEPDTFAAVTTVSSSALAINHAAGISVVWVGRDELATSTAMGVALDRSKWLARTIRAISLSQLAASKPRISLLYSLSEGENALS